MLFLFVFLQCVRDIILKNGFYFIKTKHVKLNQDQAAEFYKEHKGKHPVCPGSTFCERFRAQPKLVF